MVSTAYTEHWAIFQPKCFEEIIPQLSEPFKSCQKKPNRPSILTMAHHYMAFSGRSSGSDLLTGLRATGRLLTGHTGGTRG